MKTDIESLRKELEGMTPGPWFSTFDGDEFEVYAGIDTIFKAAPGEGVVDDVDAIVAMRNAIEGLLEDLTEAESLLREAVKQRWLSGHVVKGEIIDFLGPGATARIHRELFQALEGAKSAREPEHPDCSPTTSPFPHVAREERWTDEQIKSFAYGNLKPGSFYAMRKDGDRAVYLHRVICQPGEGMDVDHANGDTLDCRRSNLRACSRRQNNMNRPGRGASRHKGVDRRGERWRARIDGRSLGVFSTEDEAALAYNRAAVEAHGEFARLNEVQLGYEPDGLRLHSST